jgi:hypothetical protein
MPECRNSNPIFDRFSPDTKEYKTELAKEFGNRENKDLSFWYNRYLKKGEAEYIQVSVQGENLCAIAEIQVTDWSKISGMRREISGYRGAELEGLDFEIIQDSAGINFPFRDVQSVVD